MNVGYARVSTFDQHLHIQKDTLKDDDCEKVFYDITSGAKGLSTSIYFRDPDSNVIEARYY